MSMILDFEKPLISVVIPVYNASKYLEDCILSVVNQSFKGWELILVNDGSTDESPSICDSFSSIDKRIIVFHKKNEGVGFARNDGIFLAKGEFICFVDSDDWLESDAFQIAINFSKNYNFDLLQFGCNRFSGKDKILAKRVPPALQVDLHLESHSQLIPIFNSGNAFSVWGKLVKKSIIDENQLLFGRKKRGQDIDFTIRLYNKVRYVKSVPNIFYNFRVIYGVQSKYDSNIVDNHIENYLSLHELFLEVKDDSRVKSYLYKIALLWFIVVVPTNISGNSKLLIKEKIGELDRMLNSHNLNLAINDVKCYPQSFKSKIYSFIYKIKSSMILFLFSLILYRLRIIFKLSN